MFDSRKFSTFPAVLPSPRWQNTFQLKVRIARMLVVGCRLTIWPPFFKKSMLASQKTQRRRKAECAGDFVSPFGIIQLRDTKLLNPKLNSPNCLLRFSKYWNYMLKLHISWWYSYTFLGFQLKWHRQEVKKLWEKNLHTSSFGLYMGFV